MQRPRLLRLDIEVERAEAPADLKRGERAHHPTDDPRVAAIEG